MLDLHVLDKVYVAVRKGQQCAIKYRNMCIKSMKCGLLKMGHEWS